MLSGFLKRREIKKLQRSCPHKFEIVYDTGYRFERNEYDLYCPLCDKTMFQLSEREKEIVMNSQKIKENFLNDETEEYIK